MNDQECNRRIISAAWRALTNRGDMQYRALDCLQSLAGEEVTTHIYLSTKPDLPSGFLINGHSTVLQHYRHFEK